MNDTSLTCGIDVGGTKIGAAVVDAEGTILEERQVPTPAEDSAAIVTAIVELVTDLGARHHLGAVGVGAAGYIQDRSVVLFSPNLAWAQLDLRFLLESRLGLPVVIENDGNVAAWGEHRFGAATDVADLLLVTVGTGVGGGIVLGGELFRGTSGVSSEIGHLRMVPDGLPCGCGRRGCLEQYASGSALVRATREAAVRDPASARELLDRAGGGVESISGRLITQAAAEGDTFARERVDEIGRWLGEGLASLTAVLDPSAIVVGGGLSERGELLLAPVREAFGRELIAASARPAPQIRQAALANRAGVVGAADLARR